MILKVNQVGYLPLLLHRENDHGDVEAEPGVVVTCEEDSSGSVVTVEAHGSYVKVTGQGNGAATVTASNGIYTAPATVLVYGPGSPGDVWGATLG